MNMAKGSVHGTSGLRSLAITVITFNPWLKSVCHYYLEYYVIISVDEELYLKLKEDEDEDRHISLNIKSTHMLFTPSVILLTYFDIVYI